VGALEVDGRRIVMPEWHLHVVGGRMGVAIGLAYFRG
jgi:hypothetical protein